MSRKMGPDAIMLPDKYKIRRKDTYDCLIAYTKNPDIETMFSWLGDLTKALVVDLAEAESIKNKLYGRLELEFMPVKQFEYLSNEERARREKIGREIGRIASAALARRDYDGDRCWVQTSGDFDSFTISLQFVDLNPDEARLIAEAVAEKLGRIPAMK